MSLDKSPLDNCLLGLSSLGQLLQHHQMCFKDVSRNIEGCFNGVFSGFQVNLKDVERVFKATFKCDNGSFNRVCFRRVFSEFQGYLKEVPRNFQIVSKEFQGSLKVVLRKFLGCFNEV